MTTPRTVELVVNGERRAADAEPRMLLSDFLREKLGLTGTHVGCEHGVCGACTVLVNGEAARSCLMLAVQAAGSEVRTIEGLGGVDDMHPLQEAFWEKHGLQCGFCTPGMLMTAVEVAGEHAQSEPRRDSRGDVEQPLPLHRLPDNRRGGAGRGRTDAGRRGNDPRAPLHPRIASAREAQVQVLRHRAQHEAGGGHPPAHRLRHLCGRRNAAQHGARCRAAQPPCPRPHREHRQVEGRGAARRALRHDRRRGGGW